MIYNNLTKWTNVDGMVTIVYWELFVVAEHKPPQHFVPQATSAPGWNDPPALSSGSRNKVTSAH